MGEEWLSTAEAGALIGVDRRTVHRWIKQGRLPAKVIWHGEHPIYRIRRSDLLSFARRWVREEWR
jgi:excisionase family DNA binding protein